MAVIPDPYVFLFHWLTPVLMVSATLAGGFWGGGSDD